MLPGINIEIHDQRELLFGKNEIEIEAKPTVTLLVEEVRPPGYLFIMLLNVFYRLCILSMCFKSPVSYCGLWTITTITLSALP